MTSQDLPQDNNHGQYHPPRFTLHGKLGETEFRVLAALARADIIIHADADEELRQTLALFNRLTLASARQITPGATRYSITGFGHAVVSART